MVRADSEQFAGTERFMVQRRLGAGGMGIVYLALDRESGESVALKTLKQVDPTAIFRFKQEFRSLSELVHPHLIRMHELFCENNQWFFVMELIEGAVDFHAYLLGSDASDAHGVSSSQSSKPAAVTPSKFLDSSADFELEITTVNLEYWMVQKMTQDEQGHAIPLVNPDKPQVPVPLDKPYYSVTCAGGVKRLAPHRMFSDFSAAPIILTATSRF